MARKDNRTPPPTADYVYQLYQLRSTDGDEARLRNLAGQIRLLTRLEHEVKIPEQYRAITHVVRTPYMRDAWLRMVAALVQKAPTLHIEPSDVTEPAKRAANLAENWDYAAMDELNKATGEDIVAESVKHLARDGESVVKIVHRPDAWAVFPERAGDEGAERYNQRTREYKQGAPLPFAWRVVDRLQMVFGDGEYGDDWCLEYGDYPRPYLGRRWGMVEDAERTGLVRPRDRLGGQPKPEGYIESATGISTKLEYWDADWWAVVIDGAMAPGFPKPNPYSPHLPYLRAKAPDSESLLYSLLYLVPALDRVLTMKMNWAYLGSFPNPILQQIPGTMNLDVPMGAETKPSTFVWRPGKLLEIPLGFNFGFLSPPPIGRDIDELASILRSLIDIAGIPSVFRGVGGSDQAGYAINQLMQAASLSFKLAGQALQRQFERVLAFLHWLISNVINQAVYVLASAEGGRRYLALSPEGDVTATSAPVSRLGPITFSFRPTLPTDEQARAMIANQLVNSPKALMSREHALEKYLQEEDPKKIVDQIYVEEELEQEPLRSMVRQEALRQAGLLPQPQPNPAAALVGPSGQSLIPPGPGQLVPGVPGQAAAGMPSVPGLNMPMQPQQGGTMAIMPGGGRPAGAYPGQPGGPRG